MLLLKIDFKAVFQESQVRWYQAQNESGVKPERHTHADMPLDTVALSDKTGP
jgi:hypothetical protein